MDIDLALTSNAVVLGLIANMLDVNVIGSQSSIGEQREIRVTEQANILADQVTFGLGAI
ncbi:MAG: putative ubiquitin-like protein YukD [Patiriisocius sp.]